MLPSSLECSERSLCSHHSQNSQNQSRLQSQNIECNFKQLQRPSLDDKTVNDDDLRQEELIDEIENRKTLEVIREESKCSIGGVGNNNNVVHTDCMDNSARALHQHQKS